MARAKTGTRILELGRMVTALSPSFRPWQAATSSGPRLASNTMWLVPGRKELRRMVTRLPRICPPAVSSSGTWVTCWPFTSTLMTA
jgi:hypothetical protein